MALLGLLWRGDPVCAGGVPSAAEQPEPGIHWARTVRARNRSRLQTGKHRDAEVETDLNVTG